MLYKFTNKLINQNNVFNVENQVNITFISREFCEKFTDISLGDHIYFT